MPRSRLIDLSRLASRVGRGALTGIDRVEAAWADHLLALDSPLFALVRTRLGYLLLGRDGIAALLAMARGLAAPGPPGLAGRLMMRGDPVRAGALADLRRMAVARAPALLLGRMLRRLGPGFDYLNLGHANLTAPCLRRIAAAGGKVAVLLHDTIPLDHPHLARCGTVPAFARKLAAVSAHADLVLYTTRAAQAAAAPHLARAGRVPPALTAPLGVTLAPAQAHLVPPAAPMDRPFFLALGTIEPRKNLGLLAQVWAENPDLPPLYIVGHQGWERPENLQKLRTTPGITLLGALPDGAVAALMDRASALLFPSLAEGFGLPAAEAAARGLPVFCADLSALHEVLQDFPVYLAPEQPYAWARELRDHLQSGDVRNLARTGATLPGWDAHFNAMLTALAALSGPRAEINPGTVS